MAFKCDTCGRSTEVPQMGPEDDASCIAPDGPPKGWRSIWTQIEEYEDDEGGATRSTSQVSHACAECSAGMAVEEHLEAEHRSRRHVMEIGYYGLRKVDG